MILNAIVFDLDDTLYPEREFTTSGFRAVSRWAAATLGCDHDVVYHRLVELAGTAGRGRVFDTWLGEQGFPRDPMVAEMVDVYRHHRPDIELFEGVGGLLATLAQRVPLGLVSDGYLRTQQLKFEALGIAGHFRAVLFTDALGREFWKPSPVPFECVMEQLAVPAENCVYVADNPLKDFKGARAAGMRTIWSRHCSGIYSGLEPPGPEFESEIEVCDMDELRSVLLASLPPGECETP